ncbi:MAG TPA: hypothetical protein VFG61_02815 [Gaiellaceae bacterium]|jgi:hypothetical protein|nr:hypothetical protein [Gaiellaceae bacterium]
MGSQARPWFPLAGAFGALGVAALYLTIIWHEGEGELTSGRVLFVAACLAAAAIALAWGPLLEPRARAVVFAAAAAMLVVWTLLGAFSIGILLAPAAVFAVIAAASASSGARREPMLAALAAVLLVAAGLLLT